MLIGTYMCLYFLSSSWSAWVAHSGKLNQGQEKDVGVLEDCLEISSTWVSTPHLIPDFPSVTLIILFLP